MVDTSEGFRIRSVEVPGRNAWFLALGNGRRTWTTDPNAAEVLTEDQAAQLYAQRDTLPPLPNGLLALFVKVLAPGESPLPLPRAPEPQDTAPPPESPPPPRRRRSISPELAYAELERRGLG